MVILLDTDVYRENLTMPGGLPLYGKTAALEAGHPDRFLDHYAIASDFDRCLRGRAPSPPPRRTTSPARSAHARRRSPPRSSGGSRSRMPGTADWPTRCRGRIEPHEPAAATGLGVRPPELRYMTDVGGSSIPSRARCMSRGARPCPCRRCVISLTQFGDHPVLATADQRLHVVDPAGHSMLGSFPAMVVPARRFNFGECAMLAAGRDWITSLDQLRGLLFFYDPDGTPLGRVALSPILGTQPRGCTPFAARATISGGTRHDRDHRARRAGSDLLCGTPRLRLTRGNPQADAMG